MEKEERKETPMKYHRFVLFYDGRGMRGEVFFFTIEAAAGCVERLYQQGLRVSLYYRGEVIL